MESTKITQYKTTPARLSFLTLLREHKTLTLSQIIDYVVIETKKKRTTVAVSFTRTNQLNPITWALDLGFIEKTKQYYTITEKGKLYHQIASTENYLKQGKQAFPITHNVLIKETLEYVEEIYKKITLLFIKKLKERKIDILLKKEPFQNIQLLKDEIVDEVMDELREKHRKRMTNISTVTEMSGGKEEENNGMKISKVTIPEIYTPQIQAIIEFKLYQNYPIIIRDLINLDKHVEPDDSSPELDMAIENILNR
ncbi:MAG: hypothetical protein LBC03_07410 [Nitrososphaerota archaeon]|jgi:hypothetical protein|nr:hypothetical protein [Nitrososphaerota archaeon]